MIGLFSVPDKVSAIIKDSAVSYCLTVLCLIVLIWATLKFRSWYQGGSDPAADQAELLLDFKDLQRRGELTDQEFRSIQGQLVDDSADSFVVDTDAGCGPES